VYLLASALGNYIPHQHGWPTSWVLLTEVANFIRALLAAGGMRYFGGGSARFDSLKGIAVFLLFAVFLAPLTAGLAGACVVTLHQGSENFLLVWQAWFLSNAMTALTLLPIIVIGVTNAGAWLKVLRLERMLEACILAIGLLAVGIVVFDSGYAGSGAMPARLYAPLAFLLWAAVRFGPAGVSASLLVISSLAISGALRGWGPFVVESPAENLLSLQLFILSISVPLMVLGALMAERRETSRELQASYRQIKDLAGRLITAQENERTRIARELHDNFSQELASLSIALSGLRRTLPENSGAARGEIGRLQQQTIELSEEVRRLSHELHPAVLQHAGLAAALRGSFEEFGRTHAIEVAFDMNGDLDGLPGEAALCLFRIAQEAQHNIAAHARATRVQAALRRNGDLLELTVTDNGRGFNPAEARKRECLGLVSMDERARLLRGRVQIDSARHHGTAVRVLIPLDHNFRFRDDMD
jgi:two-component system sensor histidine kinase UhpB